MNHQPKPADHLPNLVTKYYQGLHQIAGPIVVVEGATDVGYDEAAEILLPTGELRRGRVLEIGNHLAILEVWGGTAGLSLANTRVRFTGTPFQLPVSAAMLGRVMNGLGEPIDGIAAPIAEDRRDVNGAPTLRISRTVAALRIYERALLTSEAVANYRATSTSSP